jgi:hypothetical protein
LWQVFIRPRPASRAALPASLQVPPETLRLVTVAADIVLRTVGMERDLGPVEEQEQLVLAGMKTRQQAIEGDEPGPALEDALEAGARS